MFLLLSSTASFPSLFFINHSINFTMKRIVFSLLITTGALFFANTKASAQCNVSGAYYDCYSVSNNSYSDSDSEVWSADGTLYWVNVSLQANHPTDAYA